jgi:hypothetical protein
MMYCVLHFFQICYELQLKLKDVIRGAIYIGTVGQEGIYMYSIYVYMLTIHIAIHCSCVHSTVCAQLHCFQQQYSSSTATFACKQ